MQPFDPVDADGAVAPTDDQVHRFLEGLVNIAHHRGGRIAHLDAQADERAQAEQLEPQPVGARSWPLLHVAEPHEVLDEPVHRGPRFAQAKGDSGAVVSGFSATSPSNLAAFPRTLTRGDPMRS